MYDIGYAMLEGSTNPDKPYLCIYAMNENGMKAAGVDLIEGRLPQNDHEVIISKHIWTNGGVSYKIGDKLSLGLGERLSEGESLTQNNPFMSEEEELQVNQQVEYTIVGLMKRPNKHIEPIFAPGYTMITFCQIKIISHM